MKPFTAILAMLVAMPLPLLAQWTPGPTLNSDLQTVTVDLVPGYADAHPRVLFTSADRAGLVLKSAAASAYWLPVLNGYNGANGLGTVPSESDIASGSNYGRIPKVLSGALSYYVTGNTTHRDQTIAWMVAYCRVDVWGTAFRPNVDIPASYYLYYISLAYDILYDQLSAGDRTIIQEGLRDHAVAIYNDNLSSAPYPYDQNHIYMPPVALAAAALAMRDTYAAETKAWLELAHAMVRRCLYVQGEDGYYYEGVAYWEYALHWLVRYADVVTRATGEDLFDVPIFAKNHLFGLYTLFPGERSSIPIGDGSSTVQGIGNGDILRRLAAAYQDTLYQGVAVLRNNDGGVIDHGSYFLWYDHDLPAAAKENFKTYHYFDDHDVVFWRSSWDADATYCGFKCGPPEGHAAADKLKVILDWNMSSGHVHPDIGNFWMYARGKNLAIDTGYLCEKWTRDQNTVLIDGRGMAVDGIYHMYDDRPYASFDAAVIEEQYLTDGFGYARGDFSTVYTDVAGKFSLKRHVMMTHDYLLVCDDLRGDAAHAYSWLLHTTNTLVRSGDVFTTSDGDVDLKVNVLSPAGYAPEVGPHTVLSGMTPGSCGTEVRGYLLKLTAPSATATSFLTVLTPLALGDTEPLSQAWQTSGNASCAKITCADYTDYFGASLDGSGSRSVINPADGDEQISWDGYYGFVRKQGTTIYACGDITSFSINATSISSVVLNGVSVEFSQNGDYTEFSGGDIEGHIEDEDTGAPLYNVKVEALQGGDTLSCFSDLNGDYDFGWVYPGTADVRFSRSGLTTVTVAGQTVTAGEDLVLDQVMSINTAAPKVLNSSVVLTTGTTASIAVRSDKPCRNRISYGADTGYGAQSSTTSDYVECDTVVLSGLTPGQMYHYQVSLWDYDGTTGTSGDFLFMPVGEFTDDFEDGDYTDKWETASTYWAEEDGIIKKISGGNFASDPERLNDILFVKDVRFGSYTLTIDGRSLRSSDKKDLCLVLNYQDSVHYYYAQLSGTRDDDYNGIFKVDDADRVKVGTAGDPCLAGTGWYAVKVVRDLNDGLLAVYCDNMVSPVFVLYDDDFGLGKIGLASERSLVEFDDIRIVPQAETAGIREPGIVRSPGSGWTGVFANPVKAAFFLDNPEFTVCGLDGRPKTAADIRNTVNGVYLVRHEATGTLRRVVIIQ